jgi:hypothetical protein
VGDLVPIDITTQLVEAGRLRSDWAPRRSQSLARALTQAIPDARLDWDEDAGEEWVRVLVDQFVVALVRASTPLVIAVRGELSHLQDIDSGPVVVIVDDLETPWLTATEESLRLAFPEREVSPTLDPAAFSGMDLWFATT